MKKISIIYSCLMIAVLSLSGCQEKVNTTLHISKNGLPSLETIPELHAKYSEFGLLSGGDPKASLKKDYGYTGELTYEALEKTYRLSFYVNLLDEEEHIIGMVLLPCDSSLEYDDFEKYPAHDGVTFIEYPVVNETLYGAYFSIEALEALGYIARDQNEQKNLCLFSKFTSADMSTSYKYSSNILTYTAEEINSVMDAYEVLR